MPEKRTVEQARKALRDGKRPTTAAGAFVREEVEHVRRGKHGARSRKQAIAIGLSKARRAGVPLPPPGKKASERTRRSAADAYEVGQKRRKPRSPSGKRSAAVRSGQAKRAAARRRTRRSSAPRARDLVSTDDVPGPEGRAHEAARVYAFRPRPSAGAGRGSPPRRAWKKRGGSAWAASVS